MNVKQIFIATFLGAMTHLSLAAMIQSSSDLEFKHFRIVSTSPVENENELLYPQLVPASYMTSLSGLYNDTLQTLSIYFGFDNGATKVQLFKDYNLQNDSVLSVFDGDSIIYNLSSYGDGDYVITVEPEDSSDVFVGGFRINEGRTREFNNGYYMTKTIDRQTEDQSEVQYLFDASIKHGIGETFNQAFRFSSGTQHTVQVISNTLCNVYVFCENNPNIFSIVRTTSWINNLISHVSFTFTPPVTGSYHILVSTSNDVSGKMCNIAIDNNGFNALSPVSYNYFSYPSLNNVDTPYNIFMTSKYFDPQLFVIGEFGNVIAYNDDYSSNDSFNWGKTARVIIDDTLNIQGIIAASDYVTHEYGPANSVDIYAGCPVVHDGTNLKTYYNSYFDSFEDIMVSGPSSLEYDHVAWVAGEINYDNPYMKLFQFNANEPDKPLAPIDAYLRSKLYTRQDATEDNSVIDLYVTPEDSICVYAAIKAYGNSTALGYAWESKVGTSERIFHPRYALKDYAEDGDSLVIIHYRRWSLFELQDMDELNLGYVDYVYRNYELTSDEIYAIRQNASGLRRRQINSFQTLYDQCRAILDNACLNSTLGLENSSTYNSLRSLCLQTPELINFAYINANNGDHLAFKLIDDIAVPQHQHLLQCVKHYNDSLKVDQNNRKIRYTIQANTVLFVKSLLDSLSNQMPLSAPKGMTSSDEHGMFDVAVNGRTLRVDIPLEEKATVSLVISSSNGMTNIMCANKQVLENGKHHFEISVNRSDIYNVTSLVSTKKWTS